MPVTYLYLYILCFTSSNLTFLFYSEGEYCPYGTKCMFIHPSDYVEPHRSSKKNQSSDEEDQGQYNLNKQFEQVSS